MKNILISICLGLSACTGHEAQPINSAPSVVESPVISPESKYLSVSGNGWSMEVPNTWKKVFMNEPSIKASFSNEKTKSLVVLIQENFSGNLEAYAKITAREIISQDGLLVSGKKLHINGHDFYLITATKDLSVAWSWVTVINGSAFGLICGGPQFEVSIQDACTTIANSLKFNDHSN